MDLGNLGRWDISHAYGHLTGIYGDANALTTPRDERCAFLLVAASDLSRCYRKESAALYPIALAQLTAWYMSVGEGLFRSVGGTILSHAMSEKYPRNHCGYCGHTPCQCEEKNRLPHQGDTLTSSEQLGWTLARWQAHLQETYGPANETGGVPRALNRLFEEIGEVSLVLHLADGHNDELREVRKKIAREMTDILAWILGVGTLLGIEVESAVRHVYANGCPVCKNAVCECRHFERRPLSGHYTHRFMPAEEIAAALAA